MNLLILIIVSLMCNEVLCKFHLTSSVKFSPPKKFENISSYFGFSISYQAGPKKLYIGAPKADNEGKVFHCSVFNQICKKVSITITAERRAPEDIFIYYKHDFLLGATVASGNNFSVTCAPRVSAAGVTKKGQPKLGTFGLCYVIDDNKGLQMEKVKSPLPKYSYRAIESIMDGYGWSLLVSKDGSVIAGSPPMDQGISVYHSTKSEPYVIRSNFKPDFGFGYSVIQGYFGNKDIKLTAISAPGGKNHKGRVLIFNNLNEVPENIIEGDTVGSLFGASLCAADIDGDGLHELIVGAPLFVPQNSYESDTGAFFVYKKSVETLQFIKTKKIVGYDAGSYFGNSIITVDDLDADGCEDICVGAPYEDNGRGAVYLYSGASLKMNGNGKYIQRISSEGFMSFGFSLHALSDYDENGCNELAIGAPESNTVILLHCFSSIELKLTPHYENIQMITMDRTSFKFFSCFDVKSKTPNFEATIDVTVQIIHTHAKIAKPNMTAFQYTTTITAAQKYCQEVDVFIPKEGDYTKLIQFRVTAKLQNDPMELKEFDLKRVLLSPRSVLTLSGSIPAARGCKNKCIPNLLMELITLKNDTVASLQKEFVEVKIISVGETAYASCVRLTVPEVAISTYPSVCVKNSEYITCRPNTYLINGDTWSTGPIALEMQDLTNSDRFLNITAKLYNYCDNMTDFSKRTALVKLKTEPEQVFIKSSSDYEDIKLTSVDLGNRETIFFTHIYTITNLGSTVWTNLKGRVSLRVNYDNAFEITYFDPNLWTNKEVFESVKDHSIIEKIIELPKLDRRNKIDEMIPIEIRLNVLDGLIQTKNFTVRTEFQIFLDEYIITNSTENLIYFQKNIQVALWIILLSVIIGILLVVFLILILYKMGCFGRKNKKKLENLKREIKRQSLRRSTLLAAREALKPVSLSSENIIAAQFDSDTEDTEKNPEGKQLTKDC